MTNSLPLTLKVTKQMRIVIDPDQVRLNDPYIRRLDKILEKQEYSLDTSLSDELDGYIHNRKKLPIGFGGVGDLQVLMSQLSKNQAHKERVLEIKLACSMKYSRLSSLYDSGKVHLLKNYFESLNLLKTKELKDSIIDSILMSIVTRRTEVEVLIEKSEGIYSELKDRYFTIKTMSDIASDLIPFNLKKEI